MSNRGFYLSCAGVKIPRFLYGTAWKKEQTQDLVIEAYHAGFRGFDTACLPKLYREDLVGDAFAELAEEGVSRGDYYLQTKFTPPTGHDSDTIPYDVNAPLDEQVHQSFECSQKNLQTDYVDAYLLHTPLATPEDTLTVWRVMETIATNGGARQLGISNCYNLEALKILHKEARIKPAVIQNRFYKRTDFDNKIRAWCMRNDLIYQGFRTLKANTEILHSSEVAAVAADHGKTPEQILLLYLTQHSVVPLTGTRSLQHMVQDLACLDDELMPPEMDSLDRLFHKQVA